MPDTDLSAALDEIRKRRDAASRARQAGTGFVAEVSSAADVARLLAAVDAVLKDHQPGRIAIIGDLCQQHATHRFYSVTRAEADDVTGCPDCRATVYDSCAGCGTSVSLDRCPVRAAISRALLGEGE